MMSIPLGLLLPSGESDDPLPVTAQVPGQGFLVYQTFYDHAPNAPVTYETGFFMNMSHNPFWDPWSLNR